MAQWSDEEEVAEERQEAIQLSRRGAATAIRAPTSTPSPSPQHPLGPVAGGEERREGREQNAHERLRGQAGVGRVVLQEGEEEAKEVGALGAEELRAEDGRMLREVRQEGRTEAVGQDLATRRAVRHNVRAPLCVIT